jgi:hypothetical protein
VTRPTRTAQPRRLGVLGTVLLALSAADCRSPEPGGARGLLPATVTARGVAAATVEWLPWRVDASRCRRAGFRRSAAS